MYIYVCMFACNLQADLVLYIDADTPSVQFRVPPPAASLDQDIVELNAGLNHEYTSIETLFTLKYWLVKKICNIYFYFSCQLLLATMSISEEDLNFDTIVSATNQQMNCWYQQFICRYLQFYLLISTNQLLISRIELLISTIQVLISTNKLLISRIELLISTIQLYH